MSRIGKQPITVPSSTQVAIAGALVTVTGPKGSLEVPVQIGVSIAVAEGAVTVTADSDATRSAQGLQRTLIQNAVTGVSEGWKRDLELHGVGMRAAVTGTDLTLNLGFSIR